MKVFDVRDVPAGVDAALAVTENPKHRHMLKNYRRHALLEVSGFWEDILIPAMTVEEPVYRISERGQTRICNGMQEVRGLYSMLVGEGANVFGALKEEVAVSDHGLFMESVFAQWAPGDDPVLASGWGDRKFDPNGWYQISHRFGACWPYRDGRLFGENIYDDPESWRVEEVDPSEIVNQAEARELLAPLLEESPLSEIEEGLKLFGEAEPASR